MASCKQINSDKYSLEVSELELKQLTFGLEFALKDLRENEKRAVEMFGEHNIALTKLRVNQLLNILVEGYLGGNGK